MGLGILKVDFMGLGILKVGIMELELGIIKLEFLGVELTILCLVMREGRGGYTTNIIIMKLGVLYSSE